MTLEEQLTEKLSTRSIGYHLSNYADLFIKPVTTWKKIISPRTTSYNLLILHLIYYTLFTYIIFKDLKLAVPIVIAEVVITTLPWLVFILPFKYFTWKSGKRINSLRLFRLLVIIKLQCGPVLVILMLLADYTRLDIFYILFNNAIWILFILCIVALPLVLQLRLLTRIAWIIINYIFFLISFAIFGLLLSNSELLDKIPNRDPISEYLDFKTKTSNSRFYIDDSYYFVLAVMKERDSTFKLKPQFASHELVLSFLKKESNTTKRIVLKLDSSAKNRNTIKLYPEKEELTMAQLEVLHIKTDSVFYKDLKLVSKLKDSAYFPSNKNYFNILNKYFKSYETPFITKTEIEKIVETKKPFGQVQFNDSIFGFLYLDSIHFKPIKNELRAAETKLERRFYYSFFLMNIFLYPVVAIEELYESE